MFLKKNTVDTPVISGITENFSDTSLKNVDDIPSITKFLRSKSNKAIKQQMFDKFKVNSVQQVIEKIKEIKGLPNMKTFNYRKIKQHL